jgi:hypothetical protein
VELYEMRETPVATARAGAINELRAALQTLPLIPALKWHLAQTTGDQSWRNVRPPLTALPTR